MTPAELQRQRATLDAVEAALAWPAAERDTQLQAQFGHDPEMLSAVRSLLSAAAVADRALPTALPMSAVAGRDEPPPERLGPYRLSALLGRGGMGSVFRGDRDDGVFRQSVAIKLMRRTLLSAAVTEQFARERQILATLQHPNIARLLDGGVTDAGQSYIVMELIEGRSITEHTTESGLDLPQTLDLFMQICAAVAYAHARLVVHADIKPSNVIVADQGQAKLVDFGVSRVLAAAGSSDDAGRPIGMTPEYSSPARQRGEPATTSDDIYSLGTLLEALLAPVRGYPADLAAIVAMARAPDADRRYASVDALRDDLRRWLSGRAVHAVGDRWGYRAGKLLRRNRWAAAIASVALLGLTGAAVALGAMYVRAEAARARAEQRFGDLRSLSGFVLFDVYDRLEQVPRALPLRRDIANEAQRYLDRLAEDQNAPEELRLELIEGLRRLARVQAMPGAANLGEVAKAQDNLTRAEKLIASLGSAPSGAVQRGLATARLQLLRAVIAHAVNLDFGAAKRDLARVRATVESILRSAPGNIEALRLGDDAAIELANVLQWQAQNARAEQVASEALQRSSGAPPTDIQRSRLLDVLAESRFYAGNVRGAVAPYREQLEILERLAAAAPLDFSLSSRVARARWALGTTLVEFGQANEAEPLLARAADEAAKLQLLEPDDKELRRMADIITSAHAQVLVMQKNYRVALPVLRDSVARRTRLADAEPENSSRARDVAVALGAYGDALADSGSVADACRVYRRASDVFARMGAQGRLPDMDRSFGLARVELRMARHCL